MIKRDVHGFVWHDEHGNLIRWVFKYGDEYHMRERAPMVSERATKKRNKTTRDKIRVVMQILPSDICGVVYSHLYLDYVSERLKQEIRAFPQLGGNRRVTKEDMRKFEQELALQRECGKMNRRRAATCVLFNMLPADLVAVVWSFLHK